MAKKTVKKAVAPKAVVKKAAVKKAPAKKAPAKKVASKKKMVVKPVVAPQIQAAVETPVVKKVAPACRCGLFGCFFGKLILFIIVFALGFVSAKFIYIGKHFFRMGPPENRPEIFVDGCLDLTKIRLPEMAEKVKASDANNDGCVTREEFDAIRQEFRDENRANRPGPAEKPGRNDNRPMRR